MSTTTTEKSIKWNASKFESKLISKIATRANKRLDVPFMRTFMDIEATHCNGCPLDLQALLEFPDLDFSHDVYGIAGHIDRTTGELRDCFVPRCAIGGAK